MAVIRTKDGGKKVLRKTEGNSARPVTVEITSTFPREGARKVVPADLERAAAAAAAAYKASLEGRSTPYDVCDLEVTVDYSYRQVHRRQRL